MHSTGERTEESVTKLIKICKKCGEYLGLDNVIKLHHLTACLKNIRETSLRGGAKLMRHCGLLVPTAGRGRTKAMRQRET